MSESSIPSRIAIAILAAIACLAPSAAYASFLPPEMMDTMATYVAWFVIIVMPVGAIALFWLVHVLPEKFAEKRHHPQAHAIQTLCLLSLVFGGLLWPIAWLWAFTKPVAYRMAYGTDKSDDYFHEMGDQVHAGNLSKYELESLREQLDAMAAKGALSGRLNALRDELPPAPNNREASA